MSVTTHLLIFSKQHLYASTSDGITDASNSQMMRVEELLNEQTEQGTSLRQMNRFQALEHLLNY